MIRINIHEAKAHLSRYLKKLRQGEVLVIFKRNIPIAEVRTIPSARTAPRPVGLARGELRVPNSFFEPLPEDVLSGFDGTNSP
jgi:antitoxin (DNA-binding transcriptional repressor) of toxin-antitoxin stability system